MRKTVFAVSIAVAILLDHFVFPMIGVVRYSPDCLVALFVSVSVLGGLLPSVPVSAVVGLILDVCFSPFIGMRALPLFGASLAGSIFFGRFYADNIVIPAITAAVVAFVKELFLLLFVIIGGGRISGYFLLFVLHILPAALLSGAVCALLHLLMKKILPRDSFRLGIDRLR